MQRKKAIVLDIDGVIVDWYKTIEKEIKNKQGTYNYKYRGYYDESYMKYPSLIFGTPRSLDVQLMNNICGSYALIGEGIIYPDTRRSVEKLKEDGFAILILTSREEDRITTGRRMVQEREATLGLLKRANIEFDEIYFSKDKVSVLKKLSEKYDINYILEDDKKYIESATEAGFKVIKYNHPHNRDCNVVGVNNISKFVSIVEKSRKFITQERKLTFA